MRILVCGGSGYLGQFLVHALAEDHQVCEGATSCKSGCETILASQEQRSYSWLYFAVDFHICFTSNGACARKCKCLQGGVLDGCSTL
jgi:UDP-glucose 4-epimerase